MLIFNAIALASSSILLDFNTSNVNIQFAALAGTCLALVDFNTSNVNIQSFKLIILLHHQDNFNTSNVNIQSTIISHFYITYTTYIPYFKPFINILPAY